MKNETFLMSVKCALEGLGSGLKTEKNFKIYMGILIIFLLINIILGSEVQELCWLTITASAVFSAEYFNTAIEGVCNRYTTEIDPAIKDIKDIAAAGVLCVGIGFFVVQALVLLPKILERLH